VHTPSTATTKAMILSDPERLTMEPHRTLVLTDVDHVLKTK
jgi:hypothetical protein